MTPVKAASTKVTARAMQSTKNTIPADCTALVVTEWGTCQTMAERSLALHREQQPFCEACSLMVKVSNWHRGSLIKNPTVTHL